MRQLKEEKMQGALARYGCAFIMNVPAASHMGGVWERQIRTIRNVLTAILMESGGRLDSTSLRTFLYEAMAIVNSRPLTTENLNDPCAPEPLTLNHWLTMKSKVILPPPGDFVKEDLYARKRWRRVQYLANNFWTSWRKEYLLNLQHLTCPGPPGPDYRPRPGSSTIVLESKFFGRGVPPSPHGRRPCN